MESEFVSSTGETDLLVQEGRRSLWERARVPVRIGPGRSLRGLSGFGGWLTSTFVASTLVHWQGSKKVKLWTAVLRIPSRPRNYYFVPDFRYAE